MEKFMKCPECGVMGLIVVPMHIKDGGYEKYQVRECRNCGKQYFTVESMDPEIKPRDTRGLLREKDYLKMRSIAG